MIDSDENILVIFCLQLKVVARAEEGLHVCVVLEVEEDVVFGEQKHEQTIIDSIANDVILQEQID